MNALQAQIMKLTNRGWRVVTQTPNSAQLARDKKPNKLMALLLLLLMILPGLLYIFWPRRTVYIYLTLRDDGMLVSSYRRYLSAQALRCAQAESRYGDRQ